MLQHSKSIFKIKKILLCPAACMRLGITDFRRRVLLATLDIPYGTTISYGELARRIGQPGASRAVGSALHMNPWIVTVPCHRVVPADFPKTVGGYRYGESLKRALISREMRNK